MAERIHFIGIGGIGMSALARILLDRGSGVSGSDAQASPLTEELAREGAKITIGHRAEAVAGAGRVVISDAIHEDNPELAEARARGIPVVRRSQLLAELMAGRRGIAVSGTHGKTTVTAMVGAILAEAGMDPTVVVGGVYPEFGGNARVGRGDWFVAEACEAYESYLDLSPELAVITNIEPDHLDHHGTADHLFASFRQFLARLQPGGCAVLCADRPEVLELAEGLDRQVATYGFAPEAQVRGAEPRAAGLSGRCRLVVEGRDHGELEVGVPGMHNLVNALGATACALRAGAPVEAAKRALAAFRGTERRFEVLGTYRDVTVVDDYAHHPTEIAATIAAARAAFPGRRLVAVFQPHLYSRTRDFADGFAEALRAADVAGLVEIYPAREAPLPGVSIGSIAERMRAAGQDARWELPKKEVASRLLPDLRPGDVVLVMGAGDVTECAHELAALLSAAEPDAASEQS